MNRRIDERDTMFSRMRLVSGSEAYKDYYKSHPHLQSIDDELRGMPTIYGPQTATFHPHLSPFADSGFDVISKIHHLDQQNNATLVTKQVIEAQEMTQQIRNFATYLGAADVGFTALSMSDLYSHRGRGEAYGKEVVKTLPHGILLVYEMSKDMVNRAPQLEQGIEAVKGYMSLATMSLWLASYITSLGYASKVHIDGNYEAYLPPIAQRAGLGAVGRMSILMHPKFGPRVRLAMISTDLPLIVSNEENKTVLAMKRFCDCCQMCAKTCPGKAISKESSMPIKDSKELGWGIVQEDCYRVWRRLGTDCGVCLSSCPFSQGLTQEEQELLLLGEVGALTAYEKYIHRQPLRVYTRDKLDIMHYPAPMLEF